MKILLSILEVKIFGNPLEAYLLALLVFFISIFLLRTLKKFILGRLKPWVEKSASKIDDFVLDLAQKTLMPLLYVGAIYFAINQLTLNTVFERLVHALAVIALTIQVTRLVLAITVYFLEQNWFKKQTEKGGTPVSKSVLTMAKVVIWGLGIVFILDNLGFNVSAIVAGLGIGGIAVALAAQTILGDLFNYFVIFFDRPFREGDFVIFEDYMGLIENIGIKSTRIRALGGEQIVISNSNLMSAKIRNYKQMAERRVLFRIGVVYETGLEKLKKIPVMIRQIIEGIKQVRFDRAHFKEFGDFSLNFEVVYFVQAPDYNTYMDIQQQINLALKEAFEKEGIEFAYPTAVEIQKPFHLAAHPSQTNPFR